MLRTVIIRIVDFSTRFAWAVITAAAVLTALCLFYAARNFSVATDVRSLFPTNLAWAQRATQFTNTFPQYDMLVVVSAPTPELADASGAKLAAALSADPAHIRAVRYPQGDTFLAREGLLFLPLPQLVQSTDSMKNATPLLGALAHDPSLRGIFDAFSAEFAGSVNMPGATASLAAPVNALSGTLTDVLAGRPAHFSWRNLLNGQSTNPGDLRRFIEVAPVLDFNALQPGRAATAAVYQAAKKLGLSRNEQARVQVTGLVPMNDAQFATLRQNAALNAIVSIGAVLLILWLALRSGKIIAAVAISVACGLSWSAALGLLLVKSLNLISIAFFVLFVGLAVDFGIQFSVRYRAERHEIGDLRRALLSAAQKAGWPLALAAAATALGFSAFLPTDYRGLSELGRIAGPGMIIAFLASITLLPALLRVFDPPGEPNPMGFASLAPVDEFMRRRRFAVLFATLGVVLLASPLLLFLRFDFNTLHLMDPKSPPVAAFLELRRDPAAAANAVDVVAPNTQAAYAIAGRLASLPEVSRAQTIASLIPTDQQTKLRLIHELAAKLRPALDKRPRPTPTDAENVAALRSAGQLFVGASAQAGAAGSAAKRLSALLTRLAAARPEIRERASQALVMPLDISLAGLRQALRARTVTIARIPPDLKRNWLAPDGHARVQILPKGDPEDTASLRKFVGAVLAHEPGATGPAVVLYEAGNTIVRSFRIAGLFAVCAIALLLLVSLRNIRDVLVTLIPLMLAAVLTMELCVVFDIPLNFTNIIAFPLLLGVGVAFKIYYIMAWRRGRTALVQSTLTRAVIFSAMTTATAFGTLWLSRHPGTSSMGQLMSLALVCTMLAAVLFQPALMGPPRQATRPKPLPKTAATREPELVAMRSAS
ncbi:MAG TPA: MMPL family transporter [Rhizomicrobium sp.]|nr:MMPL family transporter [Rhizomicrobium sp.]